MQALRFSLYDVVNAARHRPIRRDFTKDFMTTETVIAWMGKYSTLTPQDLIEMKSGIAGQLVYTNESQEQYFSENGYTKVGTAEIALHMISADGLVLNKIEALKAEAAKTRADAAARCTIIESQIQNLLAITHVPESK